MPVERTVDPERQRVVARVTGILRGADLVRYLAEARADPESRGFHAVFDLTGAEGLEFQSADALRRVAEAAARSDDANAGTRLAIVAGTDYAYGLSRMYQSYRADSTQGRQVRVFRSLDQALAWIDEATR